MKMSIWTVEGRKERIGQEVTSERLEFLKAKRTRQLSRLIEKYQGKNQYVKKVKRWQDKIFCS